MKAVLLATAAAAVVALAVLLLADGVVELLGYELLVVAAAATALWTLLDITPARAERRANKGSRLGTTRTRRRPPQLTRTLWAVEFALTTSFDSDYRLVPRLRTLAAHRLSIRHSIDLVRQPIEARRLLGSEAWEVLDPARPPQRVGKGIDMHTLDATVTAIERL